MTTDSKATPRPWELKDESRMGPKGEVDVECILEGANKHHIGYIYLGAFDDAEDAKSGIADAEFILRSVNSHDSLVEALERAKDYFNHPSRYSNQPTVLLRVINEALECATS